MHLRLRDFSALLFGQAEVGKGAKALGGTGWVELVVEKESTDVHVGAAVGPWQGNPHKVDWTKADGAMVDEWLATKRNERRGHWPGIRIGL